MRVHSHTNAAFEGDSSENSDKEAVTLKSVASMDIEDDVDDKGGWKSSQILQMGSSSSKETSSSGLGSDLSDSRDEVSAKSRGETVAILGTGDFGRALGARLVAAGYTVVFGSRDPRRNAELVDKIGCQTRFQDEAVKTSELVVVAVPKEYYNTLPLDSFDGKTLIDVSNRNSIKRKMEMSQAEYLQSLAPRAKVVKAFNVLSAYSLESGGIQGTKEVLVAGDDLTSKTAVTSLIRACGFAPVDMGGLRSAREIEDIPVQRFPDWRSPLIISSVIFLIQFLIGFAKYQFCWTYIWGDGNWHWERWNYLPMNTINKTLSIHALTLLAACYLPGVIAAWVQIIRGTKYSRFPNWLDRWLKMRKQLGLLMLFSASMHACISVAIMSPAYHTLVYGEEKKVRVGVLQGDAEVEEEEVEIYGGKMDYRGEIFLICGVTSYALAVVLGLTSLPSVTSSLTWKEFAFVQSKLGWICLLFGCGHNIAYGWPYIFSSGSCYIPPTFQSCMYLPALTILLKIPLLFLSKYLDKIRGGWERGKKQEGKNTEDA